MGFERTIINMSTEVRPTLHLFHCPACQQTVFKSFKSSLPSAPRHHNAMALGTLIFTSACSAPGFQMAICKKTLLGTVPFTLNQEVKGSISQYIFRQETWRWHLLSSLWCTDRQSLGDRGNRDCSVTFCELLKFDGVNVLPKVFVCWTAISQRGRKCQRMHRVAGGSAMQLSGMQAHATYILDL